MEKINTDTIPSNVRVNNRLLNNRWFNVEPVRREERVQEAETYISGDLVCNTYLIAYPIKTLSEINIAEAYANVTEGLDSEMSKFMWNNLVDWATACDNDNLTMPISSEITPKGISTTIDSRVEGIVSEEVKRFCEKHCLEETIYNYASIVCDVFKNATRITLSMASDPEIEGRKKIKINISIKSDIETVLMLDEELFKTIDANIPDRDNDHFVKTYEIVE